MTGDNILVVTISMHKDAAECRVAPLPPVLCKIIGLLGRELVWVGRG